MVDGKRPEALCPERFDEAFAFMMSLPPAVRFDATQRAAALRQYNQFHVARLD